MIQTTGTVAFPPGIYVTNIPPTSGQRILIIGLGIMPTIGTTHIATAIWLTYRPLPFPAQPSRDDAKHFLLGF